MSNQPTTSSKRKPLKAIKILRDRRGGVSRELLDRNRQRVATRRAIIDALKTGPKTVPQLSGQTGIPTHEALWCLMGLRKYGEVTEGNEQEGYLEYQLVSKAERE